jgi:hypothetical protein
MVVIVIYVQLFKFSIVFNKLNYFLLNFLVSDFYLFIEDKSLASIRKILYIAV